MSLSHLEKMSKVVKRMKKRTRRRKRKKKMSLKYSQYLTGTMSFALFVTQKNTTVMASFVQEVETVCLMQKLTLTSLLTI